MGDACPADTILEHGKPCNYTGLDLENKQGVLLFNPRSNRDIAMKPGIPIDIATLFTSDCRANAL